MDLYNADMSIVASDVQLGEDGSYGIVMNACDAAGTHDLAYTTLGAAGNLDAMSASAYVADDGTTMLTYGFTNNSEEVLDGYVVTVKADDQVVEQRVVSVNVAPGAIETGELTFSSVSNDAIDGLTVEIAPASITDLQDTASCEAAVATDATLEAAFEDVSDGSSSDSADDSDDSGDSSNQDGGSRSDHGTGAGSGAGSSDGSGESGSSGAATSGASASPVNLSGAIIASIPAATFTGSAIKPKPMVTYGVTKLKVGVDYTLSYANNVNAGTATVTVAGKGNYAGTKSVRFTIAKAANGLKVSGKTAKAKYSKKKASTVKAASAYRFASKGAGKLTYKRVAKGSSKWLSKVNSKTGAITVKKGAPKGKVQKVKVKVSAKGDANHKAASKTVTVKVKVR